jgi:hypothetical protein
LRFRLGFFAEWRPARSPCRAATIIFFRLVAELIPALMLATGKPSTRCCKISAFGRAELPDFHRSAPPRPGTRQPKESSSAALDHGQPGPFSATRWFLNNRPSDFRSRPRSEVYFLVVPDKWGRIQKAYAINMNCK